VVDQAGIQDSGLAARHLGSQRRRPSLVPMALSMHSKRAANSRERARDSVERLRFALDTLPNTLHGLFNPPARARILTELYAALFGSNYSLFLAPHDSLPNGTLLSDAQALSSINLPSDDGPRACQHVFKKGECCFRCK
jgi:E3 ubiquitin-protein ligase UBR1